MEYIQSGIKIDLARLRQWWDDIHPDQFSIFEQKRTKGFRYVRIHRLNLSSFPKLENLNSEQTLSESIERREVLVNGREMSRTDFGELSPYLCTGYCRTIMETFPESYYCCVIGLSEGFEYPAHVDTPVDSYRMHIVLKTNPDAEFDMEGEKFHLPADGYVYMLATGTYKHTAWNRGDTERLHLTWEMPISTYRKYQRRCKVI
jgi:hypothetical protein